MRTAGEMTAEATEGISDLQFTSAYRVPFQFSRYVHDHLRSGSFVASSAGVTVTDLDGNVFYDLTGSYGVNLVRPRTSLQILHRGQGADRVRDLRPRAGRSTHRRPLLIT